MTNGLWRTAALARADVAAFADACQVSRRVAAWALLYGLRPEGFQAWTVPESEPWLDPEEFLDMSAAVARLERAIALAEPIAVVGDYDVDGVAATCILGEALQSLGAQWFGVIPHRVHDGYGLSEPLVDRVAAQGARVLVTVDNGIAATNAVRLAVQQGLDVIITDHHTPGDALPTDALALVHWRRSRNPDLSNVLSGSGVSWKLATALLDHSATAVAAETHDWLVGLAALATVADAMPMVGENRRLVRAGLRALATCQRPGWLALCSRAQINLARCNESDLLWHITPRLNAAGRMDSAELALRLLMAPTASAAAALADQLEALNQLRRQETSAAIDEALAAYGAAPNGDAGGVVVTGPWRLGIVGIMAARLADLWRRPTLVLADDGGEALKGSGRAPDGFPLHAAVTACGHLLRQFGGHDAAIGCTVDRTHVAALTETFARACVTFAEAAATSAATVATSMADTDGLPELADDWLPIEEATASLLASVEVFRPFGTAAPMLTFLMGPAVVESVSEFSQGKHLSIRIAEQDDVCQLTWFQVPSDAPRPAVGQVVLAVVEPAQNFWRGKASVQLRIRRLFSLTRPLLRADFGKVYTALRQRRSASAADLRQALPGAAPNDLATVLETFVELGFAGRAGSAYHVNEQAPPRDLRESLRYQRHLWERACAAQEENADGV